MLSITISTLLTAHHIHVQWLCRLRQADTCQRSRSASSSRARCEAEPTVLRSDATDAGTVLLLLEALKAEEEKRRSDDGLLPPVPSCGEDKSADERSKRGWGGMMLLTAYQAEWLRGLLLFLQKSVRSWQESYFNTEGASDVV